jgi:hypothetical protein
MKLQLMVLYFFAKQWEKTKQPDLLAMTLDEKKADVIN